MRRGFPTLLLSVAAIATPALPAMAGEAALGFERHATSNALDDDTGFFDWYSHLRGSIRHTFGGDGLSLELSADGEVTAFDTLDIEDDRSAGLNATLTHRLTERIELRGTLFGRVSSEGDTIAIGDYIVGTRTGQAVLGGGVEAGFRIEPGLVLAASAELSREENGRTRFEDGVLPTTRLDPDRWRLRLAAGLSRVFGALSTGFAGSVAHERAERPGGRVLGLSFTEYTLKAEAKYTRDDGMAAGLALGTQLLRAEGGIVEEVRPYFDAALAVRARDNVQLKTEAYGRFETADIDDPLASWVTRAQAEGTITVSPEVEFGTGVFAERRENIALGNREKAWGAYVEGRRQLSPQTALVVRVEYDRRHHTIIDIEENTLDAFVGLSASM